MSTNLPKNNTLIPTKRIRYFVKLGILPHAVRLAVDGQSSIDDQQSTSTIGHLPYWTIQRLIQVDRLKRAGKSYPQIAEKFKTIDARYTKETLKKSEGIETKVAQGSKNLSLPSEEEIEPLSVPCHGTILPVYDGPMPSRSYRRPF